MRFNIESTSSSSIATTPMLDLCLPSRVYPEHKINVRQAIKTALEREEADYRSSDGSLNYSSEGAGGRVRQQLENAV